MDFPVEVAPIVARMVEYSVPAVGSVEAFERIQITARIPGAVETVRFEEGQAVKRGQVLVEIDPVRYRLAVSTAQAILAKAEAAAGEAEQAVARRESAAASSPGIIPGEEMEAHRSRAQAALAEVRTAKVALQRAEVDLRDAYVRAPRHGIVQTRNVETGQYVQPGSLLATMVRRDPLLLRFKLSEVDAARIVPGSTVRFRIDGSVEEHPAIVSHVAEAADATSRMVQVVAKVGGGGSQSLRAGAFARITVPIKAAKSAIVIPQLAVRPSEHGFITFVVEGGIARRRVVKLGMRTADGQVEVLDGLRQGESFVVRGAEPLKDGASVRIADTARASGATQGAAGSEAH
ncbi:MAG: efflux RND transporter periplasmic adaptor subunit [Pseudomonadota bacterium]